MIYLITQIALYLLLAVLFGVLIGWKFFAGKQAPVELDESEALIASKRRLDQCHRENAKLRRSAKRQKDELEKITKQMEVTDGSELASELEAANAQIQALMEDVQMRDDMIAALEKKIS